MRNRKDAGYQTLRLTVGVMFAVLGVVAMTACKTSNPSPNGNQRAVNSNESSAAQSNSSEKSSQPAQSTTGTIEVTSTPPGASVVLIANDETGSTEPQVKGITPNTIKGLAPGKYTVHLERYGYKFSQKEVTVKAGKTAKVSVALKKQ